MNIYLRPLGDSLAKALAPKSEYALKVAEERADSISKIEEEFGVAGVALATFGYILYDVKMALEEFSWGVLNALSKVYLWPIDKLGDLIGVDLPGSLNELMDEVFGIKGGFQGIREWSRTPGLARQRTTLKRTSWRAWTDRRLRDCWARIGSALNDAGDAVSRFGSQRGTASPRRSGIRHYAKRLWQLVYEPLKGTETAQATLSGIGNTFTFQSPTPLKTSVGGLNALHNAIASCSTV